MPPAETEATFTLEQNQRLSQSVIWQLQRNYFQQQGIEAWRQGSVPHYITSNPFIAETYARMVLAFLRDSQAANKTTAQQALDISQPVYIVELGAGPGRFGFHFLKQFLSILKRSELRELPFKYVLTDFAESNIAYWQSHASLRPFVESGVLDFARFDADECNALQLIHSGETLSPPSIRNPVVVIANYFFDAIPHDVFYVHEGQLHEGRVTVTSAQAEPDLTDPELISRIEVTFEHLPVSADVYAEPEFNKILHEYDQRLAETTILFPVVALKCLRFFSDLSSGNLLLLSADKGVHWEEDLLTWGEPEMVLHGGCFSTTFNYHALEQFMLNRGGQVLHTSHRHSSLDIVAFALSSTPRDFIWTSQTFEMTIERFGPDGLFHLIQGLEKKLDEMTLEQILAWLRLSRWDANLLLTLFPALLNQVAAAHPALQEEIKWIIQHVWDNFFDIGEGQNLAFYIGTLFYSMGYYSEALQHLEYSLKNFGPDVRTFYNITLCHCATQQMDKALDSIKEALKLDPAFEAAKAMRVKIESTISRQGLRTASAG